MMPFMLTEIRAAHLDDAQAIARIQVLAWQAAYRGLMPQSYLDGLDVEQRAEYWRRGLSRSHERDPILVVEADGEVVAFAAIGPASDTEAAEGELYAINVRPEYWGQGVGDALLHHVHNALAGLGHQTAMLWVLPGNQRARRFYERRGWQADGTERTAAVFEVTVPEVRYHRRLT